MSAWPAARPVVKRTLTRSVALAGVAGVVTLLCTNALARGSAMPERWVIGVLAAVMVTHVLAVLLLHGGFFHEILALDGVRDDDEPDRETLERGFARVVNAPRYWFLRAIFWFVLAAWNLSVARHLVQPEAFPWLQVVVRTVGSTAGAFLFAAMVFFLLKREFAPLRAGLARALGDPELARRFVHPVPIRTKVVVGVTGALIVATLYGAVMAQVRASRTAETAAVSLAERVLSRLGGSEDEAELESQARRNGVLHRIVYVDPVASPGLDPLGGWLEPFEIERILEDGLEGGNSLRVESAHHFAWRRLADGRLAVSLAPAELFEAHVPSMSGALGVFLGVVLLVTLAVAWLLAVDIERAVVALSAEVERLASGDLRRAEPLLWEDELGELAAHLDHMTLSLGAMIVGVRGTADRVDAAAAGIAEASAQLLTTAGEQVQGNEGLRGAISGVTNQVEGISQSAVELTASVEEGSSSILELRSAGHQLDDNASVLSEKVDEVSSSVDELIRSVRDVRGYTEHLAGASVDTSSSMEEMAASLREVDTNAVETARLSQEMIGRAEDGRTKVLETLKGMERIRETTKSARGVIRGLGDRAKKIGAIVNVIDDVAEETNLLALNAAIIAAQAGENGRSFSVVADEIKKLADRVLSSTKEIEQVITAVQEETANAVGAIEEGTRVVEQGVTQADQAGEALDEITDSARDSGTRIGEIVVAVNEQTKAAGHVVSLMERVRAGVDHIRGAGQEQERGNESMLASTEIMREISQRVRATTREQAQGSGRIADGVESVRSAVELITGSLSEQTGACQAAETEVARIEERTAAHGSLAQELDDAVGRMRGDAERLREAVGRFQV